MSYPLSQPTTSSRTYHRTYTKDPSAVWPYTINWDSIIPYGDAIDTATSTAYVHGSTTDEATDITVDSTSSTDTTTTTVLSAGLADTSYDVTVHVVTDAGYEADRTLRINCRHE